MQKAVVKGSLADRSGPEPDADVCPITGFDYPQKWPNFHRLAPYAVWWLTVLSFTILGLTMTGLTVAGFTEPALSIAWLTITVAGLTIAWLTIAGLVRLMIKFEYISDRSLLTGLLFTVAGLTITGFTVAGLVVAGIEFGFVGKEERPLSPWLTEERLCGLDGSVWQNGVIVDA